MSERMGKEYRCRERMTVSTSKPCLCEGSPRVLTPVSEFRILMTMLLLVLIRAYLNVVRLTVSYNLNRHAVEMQSAAIVGRLGDSILNLSRYLKLAY